MLSNILRISINIKDILYHLACKLDIDIDTKTNKKRNEGKINGLLPLIRT